MKAESSPAETTPIAEVMNKNPICISTDLSIDEVAALLLRHGISGAPVVDRSGKPVGVVSKTDLVREQHRNRSVLNASTAIHPQPADMDDRVLHRPRTTVAEIMTPVAFTLPSSAPISQAAALMAFESIHRLPVVSETGAVVGVVSSIDVLRWIAEREGYLLSRREIRRSSVEE
jgi:CBS domain-containing protein